MTDDDPKRGTMVRHATAADVPTIVAYQIALAEETESRSLDPKTVTRGVS